MPTKSAMTVRRGSIRKDAIILGVTRYLIGLRAITVRASICSVTLIVPNSAAIAEPALPVTIRLVRTGPNSRVMLKATVAPTSPSEPNFLNP
ncbi:MAG: hypothetical protein A4E59_01047 [Syntrophorhabdus sp. PtaB.Bin027]|nr:MAG: hypothetical protein A4E59_01047 [Syntrophorhabdus sp. PtaB.Bin027]